MTEIVSPCKQKAEAKPLKNEVTHKNEALFKKIKNLT